MLTKEEVREVVKNVINENNVERDKAFDKKLDCFKSDIKTEIDERVKDKMASLKNETTEAIREQRDTLIGLVSDMKYIRKGIDELKKNQGCFVKDSELSSEVAKVKIEIKPIKSIVYGAVGIILTAVLVGIISFVIVSKN